MTISLNKADKIKKCSDCGCIITAENRVLYKTYVRRICRKCRYSKEVACRKIKPRKSKPYNSSYTKDYLRRTGKIKKHACPYCKTLNYIKPGHQQAFCSDKCRLLFYVNKTDNCWIWIGTKNRRGYGKLSFRGNNTMPAHRASFILFNGNIPTGMCVCHSCDFPSCVNPKHLWLGTIQENNQDRMNKNRTLFGELHPKSKLKIKDIIKIRKLNSDKNYSQLKISKLFKISSGHVNNIIKRRVWNHVE